MGLNCFCLLLLSTIVILILAPIRNRNHPLSDKAYRKNRKIATIFVLVLFIIYLCLTFLNTLNCTKQ
ncbi:accessory gene regulator B family protein [Hominenteromicrobium sp.]|uniref:accessory gene regulator B family protein n=1 Tax=Hominenteromicrobium sp. TaxID=3073581 RepID=UPI003A90F490